MTVSHALVPAWVDGKLVQVDKIEAHVSGLRHMAVSVFLNAGGQTLLQQRAMGKYHSQGLWANACCTHPLWQEPPLDCAVRRLEQELGVTGVSLAHKTSLEYRADVGSGMIEHEVVEVLWAEVPDSLSITPNPDEVMGVRWITFDALREEAARHPERFTAWLKIYLERFSF